MASVIHDMGLAHCEPCGNYTPFTDKGGDLECLYCGSLVG
jgi:hypothetical protein